MATILCPHCRNSLDLGTPGLNAGDQVACPYCHGQFILPIGISGHAQATPHNDRGASAYMPQTQAGTAMWHLQTPDGMKYGPTSKAELDGWLIDGSITAACQVIQDGWPQWKWADEVYPALATPQPGATAPIGTTAVPEMPESVAVQTGTSAGAAAIRTGSHKSNLLPFAILGGLVAAVLAAVWTTLNGYTIGQSAPKVADSRSRSVTPQVSALPTANSDNDRTVQLKSKVRESGVAEMAQKDKVVIEPEVAPPAVVEPVPVSLPELIEKVEPSIVRIVGTTAAGSGFVIDTKGTVITNCHVVEGQKKLDVVFANGKAAKVLGYLEIDPLRDLAVLRIAPGGLDLQPLTLSAKDPRKGERVFAMGAPEGLSFSASDGIVSAVRRGEDHSTMLRLKTPHLAREIQTTAPISRGNSDGPLINLSGQVVGVNTWCLVAGQNLNFAVSSIDVLELVKRCGETVHPKMPELSPTSVVISSFKDEKPEESIEKPPFPVASRVWTISESRVEGQVVDLATLENPPRTPFKLTERDFALGRYVAPKSVKVVLKKESGTTHTYPSSFFSKESRVEIEKMWSEQATYTIKFKVMKRAGSLAKRFVGALERRDVYDLETTARQFALLYVIADAVMPTEHSIEIEKRTTDLLMKYVQESSMQKFNDIIHRLKTKLWSDVRRSEQVKIEFHDELRYIILGND